MIIYNIVFSPTGGENCEGSRKIQKLMNSPETSAQFQSSAVAIKVAFGSESCQQFTQFYPVLLVPSLFFIDSASGVDLEVTGGPDMTAERLSGSLDKALSAKAAKEASAALAGPSTQPSETESKATVDQKAALEDRVAKAKEMLEKRRQVKSEEDKQVCVLLKISIILDPDWLMITSNFQLKNLFLCHPISI